LGTLPFAEYMRHAKQPSTAVSTMSM